MTGAKCFVTPAQAGVQAPLGSSRRFWIPASRRNDVCGWFRIKLLETADLP
jgi:hypothetical protein